MECTNLNEQSSSGVRSVSVFMAVLPFYLLTFPLYLNMALIHRLLSLFLRRQRKEVKQVSLPDSPPNHPYENCDIEWQRAFLEHVYLDPIPDCDQFPL